MTDITTCVRCRQQRRIDFAQQYVVAPAPKTQTASSGSTERTAS